MLRATLFTILTLAVSLIAIQTPAQSPEQADKTLAPYFQIKGSDGSVDRLPLKSTSADVKIAGVIADVTITQVYENIGTTPIEAIYVFPGSTRAAVYGMTMQIGERTIEARIKERQEARHVYEAAKKAGKSASLLEQQRPNVFTMNVANILPGDTVKVMLKYTELLVPTDGVYEFVYPTVVGPRYSTKSSAGASTSDTWVSNPYLHEKESPNYSFDIRATISAGMPIRDLSCPTHKTNISYDGKSDAVITLDKSENFGGNRDFILRYRLEGDEIQSGLLLASCKDENFFLLMVQPPKRVTLSQIPPREYIFVVDVSGSMWGFPLDVSKKLLRDLIGHLNPTDRFNVILFAGRSAIFSERSVPANASNIQEAINFINRRQGGGGTNLLPALERAMALPESEGYARSVVIATDGYVDVEDETFSLIRRNLNKANFFSFGIGSSVNRHLIEGMAKVGMGEPFVVTSKSEARSTADKFREYIQSPVLTHVNVDFGKFSTYDVEPETIPDVLAERPVIIYGKWDGKTEGTITLSGMSGEGIYEKTFAVDGVKPNDSNSALRYLWARKRIALLRDFGFVGSVEGVKSEVTNLGLTYNLLTPYTSFVAVDTTPRRTDPNLKTVKQPLPLPKGVSDLAVGDSSISTSPEPETWALILVAVFMLVFVVCRRMI